MSGLPSCRTSKAIWRPSEDQLGEPVCGPLKFVTWIGFEPFASEVQISKAPDRSDLNVIRFPSDEYCGAESYFEDEINIVAASVLPFVPVSSSRQIFESRNCCAYTRRSPRGAMLKRDMLYPIAVISRSGVPPEDGTRHRPASPARYEMKTMSRPSAVQSRSLTNRLSKVNRRGSPPSADIT